jgi:hypothetical protein
MNYSFPHKLNVVAPYFHIGNGYLSDAYFGNGKSGDLYSIPQLASPNLTFYKVQMGIIRELTLRTNQDWLINEFNNFLHGQCSKFGIDLQKVNNDIKPVVDFYLPAMEEYL